MRILIYFLQEFLEIIDIKRILGILAGTLTLKIALINSPMIQLMMYGFKLVAFNFSQMISWGRVSKALLKSKDITRT